MAKHRKKRKWPVFIIMIVIICILSGLGGVGIKRISVLFTSAREVIETVKIKTEETGSVPFEKIKIPEGDVAYGYYYRQLSEDEQSLYKEMYQGILESSPSIYMHSPDVDIIKKISQFIFYDRPELFWCGGEMQITSYETYAEVQPVYTYSGTEKEERQLQIDNAAAECLNGITTEMTEYEKIKYIFEYIVNTVDYNLEAPDNQNIYSALVGKSSVCAGYSRAAQYLLEKMGMECIYVTGEIPNQGPHAWNIVKCNDQYYQMDITFGDPVFIETENGGEMPDKSINYDYLCCSDAEIMKNHTMDTLVNFPQCTSTDLNYYKLNGMYYEEFRADLLLNDMNQSIFNRESSFTCKFADYNVYQQAHDRILTDLVQQAAENLLEYYGLESVQYTYIEDEVMDKIVIFWSYE